MTFPTCIMSTEKTKIYRFQSHGEILRVKVTQETINGQAVLAATSPDLINITYISYQSSYPEYLPLEERMERTARGFEGQATDMMYSRGQ